MPTITDGLETLNGSYNIHAVGAYIQRPCPTCGALQHLVVAKTTAEDRLWLRCVNCSGAAVLNFGVMSPGVRPLSTPQGVTGLELDVWNEVRDCLAVGANTAAVMLARKLLFHIAVGHGLPAKDDRDRAPTFAAAVAHLETEGVVTAKMRPWVERIKDVGNEANHEIRPVSAAVAMDVATFTEQLLKLAYEMDALMSGGGSE